MKPERNPGGPPRLLGVLGWPIAHSLSPPMQEAALRALGLGHRYLAFAVPPPRLPAAIHGAAALGFLGLNLTLPHKEAALPLCRPDALAARIGAVNTLIFDEDPPRGLNTDVRGFQALLEHLALAPQGLRATLLGAGGAARAVAVTLLDGGASLTVVSRSARRVRIDGREPPHMEWDPARLARLLQETDLLVDATPRGLSDEPASADLLPSLPAHATVIDLVARARTPLVAAARARGLRAATGAEMLLHQGAAALEAWTGVAAPIEVMRAALRAALG